MSREKIDRQGQPRAQPVRNEPRLWADRFPFARSAGHKYDRGHVLVLSGGPSSTGAARLTATAALRSGAGLVTLASPRDALTVNAAHLTAVMLAPCDNAGELTALLMDERIDAVVLGPGLGLGVKTDHLLRATLASRQAAIVDADALTRAATHGDTLFAAIRERDAPVVLTPHEGEFARLFPDLNDNETDRAERASLAAKRTGATVLLKGSQTMIAAPDGRLALNDNAPPWLATAGSGDTLAGIIAAMVAGGMDGFDAACAGAWLHGKAATMLGPGMTAEDLDGGLREAIRSLYASHFPGALKSMNDRQDTSPLITDWDDAYDNRKHIPGAADFPPRWQASAADFRRRMEESGRARLGLRYGTAARQTFDLFLPEDTPKGLVVFVHGGFWRAYDPSVWSHLATGPLAHGHAVAMPSYTLAPGARIRAMTREIAASIEQAATEVTGPIRLIGHSAGGHLVTRMLCPDVPLAANVRSRIAHVVSLSGLHDLRPFLKLAMNDTLRLDAAEAVAESPALLKPVEGIPVTAWVGGDELPEFIRQTRLLPLIWGGLGIAATTVEEPGRHHFDVIDGLADPDHPLTQTLLPL